MIARACGRVRNIIFDPKNKNSVDPHEIIEEIYYINGIADTARNNIIAYSREHLGFIPFFEHPAYPGVEQTNEVIHGTPPERAKLSTKK